MSISLIMYVFSFTKGKISDMDERKNFKLFETPTPARVS